MKKAFLKDEMNYSGKLNVALIAFPWQSNAPYKFLSDVLKILEPITNKIVLIDGNTNRIEINSEKVEVRDIGISLHYYKDIKPPYYSAISWLIKCIRAQLKTSLQLKQASKDVDIVIFYQTYPYYLLTLIVSKLLKKKTVEIITRSKTNSFFSKIIDLRNPLVFSLLDGISPQSKALIKEWGLEKYKNKLLPEGARYINLSRYNIKKKIHERNKKVGFIGRIKKEKGIMEFVRSIPLIIREKEDIEFLIGGSGDLLNSVKNECIKIEKNYKVKITIPGWIGQNLPEYYNELKLLILPTQHGEGLPTIILEAIACGTPVLATSVGGIPDLIKDEETGFIMENNSSKCIAKNVIRALNHPNLDDIVKNAYTLLEKKYTYEGAVKRYGLILQRTLDK